jgi:ribulose-phosphate 3-epimerase
MTTNPDAYLYELAGAGVDLVTMHIEAVPDPRRAMKRAADNGLDFGLVCNPATPFDSLAPFVESCRIVLIMSVEPGFGGQAFIPESLHKVEAAREWVENRGLAADIQIDGGITPENSARAVNAGATVLVAGTAVFAADDPVAAIQQMRRAKETDD